MSTVLFDRPVAARHAAPVSTPQRSFVRRVFLGPSADPGWARPAFIGLLLITAIAYTWNLAINADANSFYAAAVQAGTESWKAFLFGSSDAGNSITVDKTPGALWPMEIFGRIFGFHSWSMLLPSAIEGVASVALLHAAVKRWFGASAGLLAGGILAATPIAAVMFRFNNPDAALVFAMILAAYFVTRAIESASWKWMVATGLALGYAFLAKEMQALLVVPGFGLAYLVCAPTNFVRRTAHLAAGLAAMLVAAGWWIAVALLWPAASRPYIGGSGDNNVLSLIWGYNGLGRITGNSAGNGGGGGGAGVSFSGSTGLFRLFNSLVGGQISWLLPAAFLALVVGLVMCVRTSRTNRALAALIVWGGWLFVTAVTLSFASGTIHTYYSVALAPAIGAVLGIVVPRLWSQRHLLANRIFMSVMLLATGVWSYALLHRTSTMPSLGYFILGASFIGAIGIMCEEFFGTFRRRAAVAIATLCLVASLSGPAAYALDSINVSHTGSTPSAGPSTGGLGNFGGGDASTSVSATLVATLKVNASEYRWVAAASGSQSAAPYQLASGEPVMSIGGFTGSDASPTLAQFEAYVKAGDIHYYIAGGGMGGGGGMTGQGSSSVASWVEANFTSTTVGGVTLYDLTSPTTSAS